MGRLHPHIRPHVRAHVRSPLNGPYAASSFHDGISFNAATGRVVIKAPGASPTITTLTSAFTFTGGNQSMYRAQSGLLVPSVTNTPRIEYGPGGEVYGLLMEASRTNLCIQSSDLSTSWTFVGATASANTAASPDGTVNADSLVEDVALSQHRAISANATVVAATVYTASYFVKASGRTRGRIAYIDSTGTDGVGAWFDLSAGTISSTTVFGAGTLTASGIQAYGNGFYRVWVSGALNNAKVSGNIWLNTATADASVSHTGSGAEALILYGADLEAGNFPTSYIPTTTVSVVRTADTCIRTLASEFSATAGTAVVAGRASGGQDAAAAQSFWSFDDGTVNNRIFYTRPAATDIARFTVVTATVSQFALGATFSNSTAFKASSAWATNDAAQSFNGAAAITSSTLTVPTVTTLGLGIMAGIAQANGHIRTFDYYPTRLANNYLQQVSA